MRLYAELFGDHTAQTPMVLIHGFGGSAAAWNSVRSFLPATMPLIVYDLPGHRHSVNAEGSGGAGRMAKALLADLDARGIGQFHLAGHSMGGAVATLIALRAGDRVGSLTLFAPGGMGPEIDAAGLKAFARAETAEAIRAEMQTMVANGFHVPEELINSIVAERQQVGAKEALLSVYAAMFASEGAAEQGAIPRDMLASITKPAAVYWGDLDPTLPVSQMARMPENFEKTTISGVGHMLLDECPERVAHALISAFGR
ncbi:alpha/beta fold hydrolase [Rhizobium sp. L1K21]|uniref:alpha/beta fold hydrolase n=1 Tax=Rhizobium sp. L1K21 TaxID=2954933 RepID=UPI0020928AEE|nr:alpha/beta fold hydrolase [Rhizobium sp. L1K21]MCO6185408.1 alpha/beta fold hydrolase [Rhizobium sp. L1K21]